MDWPLAHHAEVAASESAADAATHVWESDLADVAALPLTAVDGLSPLPPAGRLLAEVLRARGGIRGGGEPARAE
ncbi:hypothetical protein [Streptomyces lincolnensis]|uniref:hypothetical protein n=1 Tax=Streptomyces lincolnensis TaxID=1915 RepID=UPI0037D0127D